MTNRSLHNRENGQESPARAAIIVLAAETLGTGLLAG